MPRPHFVLGDDDYKKSTQTSAFFILYEFFEPAENGSRKLLYEFFPKNLDNESNNKN